MENDPLQNSVLSAEDLTQFEQDGYVHLPNAFSRTDALAIQDSIWTQMQAQGLAREERSTWPAGAWRGVQDYPSLEQGIASPRLCGAINQLIGRDTWRVPTRWGGFAVTFPLQNGQEWELTRKDWHWDDTLINHFGKCSTGLFIFTLFSSLQAQGGGTLIVPGSHQLIKRFFERLSPADQQLKQKSLKKRFAQSQPWLAELTGITRVWSNRADRFMRETTVVDGVPVKVLEITGEPGDAYLCHPAIYHAATPNHADFPRFMRIKGLLKQVT